MVCCLSPNMCWGYAPLGQTVLVLLHFGCHEMGLETISGSSDSSEWYKKLPIHMDSHHGSSFHTANLSQYTRTVRPFLNQQSYQGSTLVWVKQSSHHLFYVVWLAFPINFVGWLVVIPTPLQNDGVRQLGWWHSQYMEKSSIHVPVTTIPSICGRFSYSSIRKLGWWLFPIYGMFQTTNQVFICIHYFQPNGMIVPNIWNNKNTCSKSPFPDIPSFCGLWHQLAPSHLHPGRCGRIIPFASGRRGWFQ